MIFQCSNKMQPKRDCPTFNIRKVQRKGCSKPFDQFGLFTPECEFDKYPEISTYTNPKRQKEQMIDYSINEAILNSKAYSDLKNVYNENKRKNNQKKFQLEQEVLKLRRQREEAIEQEHRLQIERKKYQELMYGLKERIMEVRERNRLTRQHIQKKMNNEAQYLSNLLISMRFQAQYQHDIDPDQMTYQQLLELQEKMGSVSRGLPPHLLEKIPSFDLEQAVEDQCAICICIMEKGEKVSELPPCKHMFHTECIMGWLNKEKVCSLCKRQIVIEQ